MLNTYNTNQNQTTKVNSVSGTLIKSHPKSFIKACHPNSNTADIYYNNESYIILQAMNINYNEWLLFEVIKKEDCEV